MRRIGFAETLAVLLVADVLTAAFRWWRGASGLTVFMGFALGVLVSLVMAEALTRLGERD